MVRNLLYSICLHFIFILFIIFNGKINDILSNKAVNIDGLDIESNFLKKNDIKVTEEDIYSNLTLNEKIELYELAKQNYDKNKKFTKFSTDSLKKKLKSYEKIKKLPIKEDILIENNKEFDKDLARVENKANRVLYLGPTDYKKLLARIQRQNEELQKEDDDKKEIELAKKVDVIKEEEYIKNNEKLNIQEQNNEEVEEGLENIELSEPVNFIEPKEIIQTTENINIKNTKENAKNPENITDTQINNKKNQIIIDKRITEILSKNLNTNKEVKEQTEVNKEENKISEKFNIDINKIFTKNDLKNIKKHIRKEGLGALTLREKVNIQNQIIMCYKNAILQTKKNSKVKVSVTLKLFQDGIIDTKKINIKIIDDKNKFNENDYNIAVENVKLALAYCNPLRNLPLIKYQSWQHINFIFDTTTVK